MPNMPTGHANRLLPALRRVVLVRVSISIHWTDGFSNSISLAMRTFENDSAVSA